MKIDPTSRAKNKRFSNTNAIVSVTLVPRLVAVCILNPTSSTKEKKLKPITNPGTAAPRAQAMAAKQPNRWPQAAPMIMAIAAKQKPIISQMPITAGIPTPEFAGGKTGFRVWQGGGIVVLRTSAGLPARRVAVPGPYVEEPP
jgi:hypothetical protein